MALIKTRTEKGIDCNYWIISKYDWEKQTNKTHITLALYASESARQNSIGNIMRVDGFTVDGGEYTLAQLYAKIKESKIETISILTNPESPEEEWVYETVTRETNWFADAIDG